MIALDTNILARFLLNDDPEQFRRAKTLFESGGELTAPVTVILELVWLLRVNGCSRPDIVKGLRLLLGLPNFSPRGHDALLRALAWYENGMDFGDALHLAMSAAEQRMITFDQNFSKAVKRLDASPDVELL